MSFIRWRFRPSSAAVPLPESFGPPVVVVGAGPSGMRAAQELAQRAPHRSVLLFGDERWRPYNRVRLTPLMAGEIDLSDVYYPDVAASTAPQTRLIPARIVAIDRVRQVVTTAGGEEHEYSHLVIATGSRPHIPRIPGIDQKNIFTFRDLDDAERLMARAVRSRRAVVVGGGLLGLEAARGLHERGIEVLVVEHERHLMPRQLDDAAATLLATHISGLGIEVIVGDGIREISGVGSVRGVRLISGREIECDTVVVCTGIRPNVKLAHDAGLAVGRAIRVDDQMRTSDPAIYAIGECAEHRGKIYGLVAPGLEQAAVAAHAILGGRPRYAGSTAATRLKVIGVPVFNIGAVEESEQRPEFEFAVFAEAGSRIYRRLIVDRGRLVGAIAIGEWSDMSRIQEAVVARRRIWSWDLRRFRRDGTLWPAPAAQAVANWPAGAIVCNCTGVTRGSLSGAVATGCVSVEDLQKRTGASTVCGSCRPHLSDLLGAPATAAKATAWKTLGAISAAAVAAAMLFMFLAPVPYRQSVQDALQIDLLWTESTYKQISGFSLLGLSAIALLLSLRKRIRRFSFGGFGAWRLVHAGIGLAAIVTLLAHTGLRLGNNFNMAVMSVFLAILLAGGLAGASVAVEHALGAGAGPRLRKWSTWVHIVAFWPMLVLLTFHVITVYYF